MPPEDHAPEMSTQEALAKIAEIMDGFKDEVAATGDKIKEIGDAMTKTEYNPNGYVSVVNPSFIYFFGDEEPVLEDYGHAVWVNTATKTHHLGVGTKKAFKADPYLYLGSGFVQQVTHNSGSLEVPPTSTSDGVGGPMMLNNKNKWQPMMPVEVPKAGKPEPQMVKLYEHSESGMTIMLGKDVPTIHMKDTEGQFFYWLDTVAKLVWKNDGQGSWSETGISVHTPSTNKKPLPADIYFDSEHVNIWLDDKWQHCKDAAVMWLGGKPTKETQYITAKNITIDNIKIDANGMGVIKPDKKEAVVPEAKTPVELRKYDGGKVVPRIYYVGDNQPMTVPDEGEKKIYWVKTTDNTIWKWEGSGWSHAHYYTVRENMDGEKEDGDVVLGNGEITVYKWGSWTKLTPVPMSGVVMDEPVAAAEPVAAKEEATPKAPPVESPLDPAEMFGKFYHWQTKTLVYVADFAPDNVVDKAYSDNDVIKIYWADRVSKKVWKRGPQGKWELTLRVLRIDINDTPMDGDFHVKEWSQTAYLCNKGVYCTMAKESIGKSDLKVTGEKKTVEPATPMVNVRKYLRTGTAQKYFVAPLDPQNGLGGAGHFWVNTETKMVWRWLVSKKSWVKASTTTGLVQVVTTLQAGGSGGDVCLPEGTDLAYTLTNKTWVQMGLLEEFKTLDPNAPVAETVKVQGPDMAKGALVYSHPVKQERTYYIGSGKPDSQYQKPGSFWVNVTAMEVLRWNQTVGEWQVVAPYSMGGSLKESAKPGAVMWVSGQPDVKGFYGYTAYSGWLKLVPGKQDEGTGKEDAPVLYKHPTKNRVYHLSGGFPQDKYKGAGAYWVNTVSGVIWGWDPYMTHWEALKQAKYEVVAGDKTPNAVAGSLIFSGSTLQVRVAGEGWLDMKPVGATAAKTVKAAVPETYLASEGFLGFNRIITVSVTEPEVLTNIDHKLAQYWVNPDTGAVCWSHNNAWEKEAKQKFFIGPVSGKVSDGDMRLADGGGLRFYFNAKWHNLPVWEVAVAEPGEPLVYEAEGIGGFTKVTMHVHAGEPVGGFINEPGVVQFWLDPVSGQRWELNVLGQWVKTDYQMLNHTSIWSVASQWPWGVINDKDKGYYLANGKSWAPMKLVGGGMVKAEKPMVFKGKYSSANHADITITVGKPDAEPESHGHISFAVDPDAGKVWDWNTFDEAWQEMGYKSGYHTTEATQKDKGKQWDVLVAKDHHAAYLKYDGAWVVIYPEGEHAPVPVAAPAVEPLLYTGSVGFGGFCKVRVFVQNGEPDPEVKYESGTITFWLNPATGQRWERMTDGWATVTYKNKFTGKIQAHEGVWAIGYKDAEMGIVFDGEVTKLKLWTPVKAEPVKLKGTVKFAGQVKDAGMSGMVTAYVSSEPASEGFKKEGITFWLNPDTGMVSEYWGGSWHVTKYTVGYGLNDGTTKDNWTISVSPDWTKLSVCHDKKWYDLQMDPGSVDSVKPAEAAVAAEWAGVRYFTPVKVPGLSRIYILSHGEPKAVEPKQMNYLDKSKQYWLNLSAEKVMVTSWADGEWEPSGVDTLFLNKGAGAVKASRNIRIDDGKVYVHKHDQWHEMVEIDIETGKEVTVKAAVAEAKPVTPVIPVKPALSYPFKHNLFHVGTKAQATAAVKASTKKDAAHYWIDPETLALRGWDWGTAGSSGKWDSPVDLVKVFPTVDGKSKVSEKPGDWVFCLDGELLWINNTTGWTMLHPTETAWAVAVADAVEPAPEPATGATGLLFKIKKYGYHRQYLMQEEEPTAEAVKKLVGGKTIKTFWIRPSDGKTRKWVSSQSGWVPYTVGKFYAKMPAQSPEIEDVLLDHGDLKMWSGESAGWLEMEKSTYTVLDHGVLMTPVNEGFGGAWEEYKNVISHAKTIYAGGKGFGKKATMESMISAGAWSIPAGQKWDLLPPAAVPAEASYKLEGDTVTLGGVEYVKKGSAAAQEGGAAPKGSVLDHKGEKADAVAAGATLEPGDTVMVGAGEHVGKIVSVGKITYLNDGKYYVAFKVQGQWYSEHPHKLVLLEKSEKGGVK